MDARTCAVPRGRPRLLPLAGAAALLAGAVALILSMDDAGPETEPVSFETLQDGPLLDGMRFSGTLGPVGKPGDVADEFVFEDGTFLSEECQRRCAYGASRYFVRADGDRLWFATESHCAESDATMLWQGTVEDGRIAGQVSWTVPRWYRTVEKEFHFSGTLVEGRASDGN